MFFLRCKEVFLERKYYYLIAYLFGYCMSLSFTGIQNIYYLFPIKLSAFCIMITIGTALYYGFQRVPIFSIVARSIKHVIIIILLLLVTQFIQNLMLTKYNIDITPIIGFE